MAQSGLWHSSNFWQPPHENGSVPYLPTELERLAMKHGIDTDEFRALVHDAIQRRLREKGAAEERLDRMLEKRVEP